MTISSFREQGGEPPYFDALRDLSGSAGRRFFEASAVEGAAEASLWAEPMEAVFLVNWRYRIPVARVAGARLGAFVFHDSLLPAYRGFSPTVWAIVNGEKSTGATLFRLAEEIDAGPILDQVEVPIGPEETISAVFERVTAAYLSLLERNLPDILAGKARGRPQNPKDATYACRRKPEDNRIDWSRSTRSIHDLIRGVTHPYTGAYTIHKSRPLRIWAARPDPSPLRYVGRIPGRVVGSRGDAVAVLTGDGTLLLETVQLEDGPETPAGEVLRGVGAHLD